MDVIISKPVPAQVIQQNMQDLHDGLDSLWRHSVAAQVKRMRVRKPKSASLPHFQIGDTVLEAKGVSRGTAQHAGHGVDRATRGGWCSKLVCVRSATGSGQAQASGCTRGPHASVRQRAAGDAGECYGNRAGGAA